MPIALKDTPLPGVVLIMYAPTVVTFTFNETVFKAPRAVPAA